jgi:hypothetical protein
MGALRQLATMIRHVCETPIEEVPREEMEDDILHVLGAARPEREDRRRRPDPLPIVNGAE